TLSLEAITGALIAALEARRGAPLDALTRGFAEDVARMGRAYRRADEDAEELARLRREGVGRRPKWTAVEAMRLRRGREWESYLEGVGRLCAMAGVSLASPAPAAGDLADGAGIRAEMQAASERFTEKLQHLAERRRPAP